MIVIEKKDFRKTKLTRILLPWIMRKHVVPVHTEKILRQNNGEAEFCEEATHYISVDSIPIYFSYDACTWLVDNKFVVLFDRICIYENAVEYMRARLVVTTTPYSTGSNLN